jgi:hypothetical protein
MEPKRFGRLTGGCSDEERAQFTDADLLKRHRKNMLLQQRSVERVVQLAPVFLPDTARMELTEVSCQKLLVLNARTPAPADLKLRAIHTRMVRMRVGTESGGHPRLATQSYIVPHADGHHHISILNRFEFVARSSMQHRNVPLEAASQSRSTLLRHQLVFQRDVNCAYQSVPGVALLTFAPNEQVINGKPVRSVLNISQRGQEAPLMQIATGIPKYITTHTAIYAAQDTGILLPLIERINIKCKHERGNEDVVRVQTDGTYQCTCTAKEGGIEVREFISTKDTSTGRWLQTAAADEYDLQLLIESEKNSLRLRRQVAAEKRKRVQQRMFFEQHANDTVEAATCLAHIATAASAVTQQGIDAETDTDDDLQRAPPSIRAAVTHSHRNQGSIQTASHAT